MIKCAARMIMHGNIIKGIDKNGNNNVCLLCADAKIQDHDILCDHENKERDE